MCASMSDLPSGGFHPYQNFDVALDSVFAGVFQDDIVDGIKKKRQSGSIASYLKELKATYFFVEKEYVDKDFIEDYAHYYSRCFTPYRKVCRRVHFFGAGFDPDRAKEKLWGRVGGKGIVEIQDALSLYLGFIVFRPLPYTVYGRVCLRPLNLSDSGESRYPAIQNVTAHLMGVPLTIKTMPYQEQDTVVAACATSALWSAFQITGRKFIHCIPSPNHITSLATQGGSCTTRAFPSGGLFANEMGRAVHKVGLTQQIVQFLSSDVFRTEVYAYLRLGLPVVLLASVYANGKQEGNHAITISGYHLGDVKAVASWKGLPLIGTAIDRFFCHDDRIGPFVDVTMDGEKLRTPIKGDRACGCSCRLAGIW